MATWIAPTGPPIKDYKTATWSHYYNFTTQREPTRFFRQKQKSNIPNINIFFLSFSKQLSVAIAGGVAPPIELLLSIVCAPQTGAWINPISHVVYASEVFSLLFVIICVTATGTCVSWLNSYPCLSFPWKILWSTPGASSLSLSLSSLSTIILGTGNKAPDISNLIAVRAWQQAH